MQSKTLCFNRTLFRKNLSRFWPLWAVYTVIWMVMLPLLQFTSSRSRYQAVEFSLLRFREYTLEAAADAAVTMALIFGVLFAMVGFGYLCTTRAVGMMHSFPIRRESVFFTNFLAGLFMQISSLVLVGGLTFLVQVTSPVGVAGKELLLWLAVNAGLVLFFYSFGVFCLMFTGQVLAIPAFYGILNILVVGVEWLARNFSAAFLYGAAGSEISRAAVWLSPVFKLYRDLGTNYTGVGMDRDNPASEIVLRGLGAVWVYAAAGLVLAGLALVVYRLRRSESAGDTVAIAWAKPLFIYGVAICVALGLGQGLYYITWGQFYSGPNNSLITMLVCMLPMGFVGYFGAEMLLRKDFRVLKSTWKGAVGLAVGLMLFGVGLSVDIIGFESRVPAVSQVESVYLSIGGQSYISVNTQDADVIARIEAAHQTIISEKDLQKQREQDQASFNNSTFLQMSYRLNNGTEVRRSYDLRYTQADLAQPQSGAAQINALYSDPVVQRQYLLNDCTLEQVSGGGFDYYLSETTGWKNYRLTTEEAQTLFIAVTEDIEAGRTGSGQFLPDETEDILFGNRLTFTYHWTECALEPYQNPRYLDIPLTIHCASTIAALQALGVLDGERELLTEEQMRTRQNLELGKEIAVNRPVMLVSAEPEVDSQQSTV